MPGSRLLLPGSALVLPGHASPSLLSRGPVQPGKRCHGSATARDVGGRARSPLCASGVEVHSPHTRPRSTSQAPTSGSYKDDDALGGPEGGRLRTSAGRSLRWEALAGAPPVLHCEPGHKEPSALAPQDRGPGPELEVCSRLPMSFQTCSPGRHDPNGIKGATKSSASSWDRRERREFLASWRCSPLHWKGALQISIQTYQPIAYQPALCWSVQESTISQNSQGEEKSMQQLIHFPTSTPQTKLVPDLRGPQK